MSHNHSYKKRKSNRHKHSLFREYRFEITVVTLFGLGVFLLTEKMNIKAYILHLILSAVSAVKTFILLIINFITNIVGEVETSDIVGILLILTAVWMVFMRIRYRIIRRYALLDSCPSCDGNLRRVHRALVHRLIEILLVAKVKHYSCKKCTYRGITIGYRSK